MPTKEPYILHGRIVTMDAAQTIVANGYVGIREGTIAFVRDSVDNLPADFENSRIVDTNGTIYPGLIDLHNHFVYNVLPLWVVPKKYANRSQWPSHPEYKAGVSKPIKQALSKYSISAKAVVRFVEGKAIMGGTTTGQGMRTQVNGGSKMFEGALRFVEEPGNENLLPAGSMVPDLVTTGATAKERIENFRRALENPDRGAYFYHLSEGVDDRARQHFLNLQEYDLVQPKLVGIHSLGLQEDDLAVMKEQGAKLVWSPFSNQLLYGQTLDLRQLKDSGIQFSIGCDWSPSGSKNMLQELKVAWHTNQEQGTVFSPYELIAAVTSGAAALPGWQEYIGTIEEGKLADLLVIDGAADDVYMHLLMAVEKDVQLVIIDGTPRYGEAASMQQFQFNPEHPLELFSVSGREKMFNLYSEQSPINDTGFGQAIATLTDIMSDLPGFLRRMEEEVSRLMADGIMPVQEFTIQPDNEFEIEADVFQEYEAPTDPVLLADVPMADSVELDGPVVEGDSYWERIDAQKNISQSLKDWLKKCYGQ